MNIGGLDKSSNFKIFWINFVFILCSDPHPGNLLARDGQLIILDWGNNWFLSRKFCILLLEFFFSLFILFCFFRNPGLVTYVTPELQNAIIKYTAHLIAKDFDAIAVRAESRNHRSFMGIGFVLILSINPSHGRFPLFFIYSLWNIFLSIQTDLVALGFVPKEKIQFMKDTGVVKVVALVFRQLASGGGPSKVNVSTLSAELNSIRAKYGNLLQIPAYFAYILRAFAVLEGLGLSYDPDFSIVDECYP